MAHSFTAPDEASAQLLKLVAAYGGVKLSVDISGQDVEFVANGSKAFGLHTACRFLASLGSAAAQLLGEAADQQAKVRVRGP